MEVAFSLLERGLLNIPDVGTINVKQARAFLWNAAWLQEYLVGEWREETVISALKDRPRQFTDFALLVIGPGGIAVLKMVEALIVFFCQI